MDVLVGGFKWTGSADVDKAIAQMQALQAASRGASDALGAVSLPQKTASPAPASRGGAPSAGRGSANPSPKPRATPEKKEAKFENPAVALAKQVAADQKESAAYEKSQKKKLDVQDRAEQKSLANQAKVAAKKASDSAKAKKAAEKRDADEKKNVKTGWTQLGGAALGAAGVVALLSPLALGYRGMERLAGITARARLNFRGLFSGVNPKPILDTLERTSLLFSKQTVAGRALGGLLTRSFNGLFGGVKSGEPFIQDFIKGLILGGLKLENVWLRARITLFPLTSILGSMLNTVGVGATLGQVAVAGLTIKLIGSASAALGLGAATWAAVAPFVALGAAALVAYNIIKKTFDAADKAASKSVEAEAERGNLLGKARYEKRTKGAVSAETRAALAKQEGDLSGKVAASSRVNGAAALAGGTATADDAANIANRKVLEEDLEATRALLADKGEAAGAALGAGLVAGMQGAEPAVKAAGAGLGSAADKGVTEKAEIHSPSRLLTRRGRQMGEGVVVGVKAMGPRVEAAAREAFVPSEGATGGARGGAGIGGAAPIVVQLSMPNYIGPREELLSFIQEGLDVAGRNIRMRAGLAG